MELEQAIKNRRSIYTLSNVATVSDEEIENIVTTALLHSPTSFNTQSPRAVLLLGKHHQALWDIVMETLRKIVPPEKFATTEAKINSFAAGYGSVLYFEDETVTQSYMQKFPSYSENFPVWAMQHNGIFMYTVWTMLEANGMGASLQHYNPLIDEEVKQHWDIPTGWKLLAQMPFGKATQPPEEKEYQPVEERYKLFK